MSNDKIFADGFYFNRNERAPDWVIGRVSVNVDQAIEFLKAHVNDTGYVNINVHKSRSGKTYCELDQWKPGQKKSSPAAPAAEPPHFDDDIPF